MDQETRKSGEGAGADSAQQPDAGGKHESEIIEATGDAILISEGFHALAGAFRELAAAIRQVSAQPDERDDIDEEKQDRYLDGTPIKK